MSPPHAPNKSTGPNWNAVRSPTAMPLSVRWSTSSVCVTSVSQLPICEMPWPMKKSRKLRYRNDRNVASEKPLSRVTVPAPRVARGERR